MSEEIGLSRAKESCSCMVQQLSSPAGAGVTLLPMRCTGHHLQSDIRTHKVFAPGLLHISQAGQLSRRSLPSIVTIGGASWQMEVSFAPRSIDNLSRTPTEMLPVLHKGHEHRDGPVFHLVWLKRKTTSRLTGPASERTDESKLLRHHIRED